ncbi:MAG: tetratricopeptide repeat protein [Desulfuromonadales bacterium]|nr:tetratricopeptide repeat protein [Desulfuromonadales bacterium]
MTRANTGGSLIGKIGSYLQIFAKDPSSTAFVPLAEAYRQIGLLDDALEAARLGTSSLPHFSPGFSTMGRILGQMGRIDEAMSAYAKALSIDRQSQAALVGLARLHLIRAERDMARKILKQAEEFHPDDEKISDMLNALELPRPWAEIKQASQLQKPTPQVATLPDKAGPSDKPGSSDRPGAPIPTATLAEIYVKQGLLDKAIKIYQDIITQAPDNTAAQNRLVELQKQSALQLDTSVGKTDTAVGQTETGVGRTETAVGQTETVASKNEQLSKITAADVTQPITAETSVSVATSTPVTTPESQNVPDDQSPLSVLKSWLTAIKLGRTNV